jgi:hypothetical protein
MPAPVPPCTRLGAQCRSLPVTLRIGTYRTPDESLDHEATWLLGHTERLAFRNLRREGADLLVDALLRVRCRHLRRAGASDSDPVRCAAHGYEGSLPAEEPWPLQPRRLGGDRFRVVSGGVEADLTLPLPPRSLPVLDDAEDMNPCAIAPCTTADHKRGSACCRDMQLEIRCAEEGSHQEALIRSRLSPYLCKVSREAKGWIEAELISACGYLDDAGLNCTLHGRTRADGRPAKPDLCSEWPDDGKGLHPGCLWYTPPKKKR